MMFLLHSCDVSSEPLPNMCPAVPGPPGLNGRDGRDGKDGAPGSPGIQGSPGLAGTPGLRGHPGPPGKYGPPGSKGDAGQKGDKGDEGPQGDAGKQGLKGDPGHSGIKGERGQKGDPDTLTEERIISLEKQISMLRNQLTALQREVTFKEELAKVGDKIYATNGKEVNFEASRKACEAAGGTLPTPLNPEEDEAIAKIMKSKSKRVFLGINDKEEEGVFKHLEGKRITFANWSANEPNNGGDEDCVEMIANGKWNDIACHHIGITVCEFKALPA